jgi:hypothetical protein
LKFYFIMILLILSAGRNIYSQEFVDLSLTAGTGLISSNSPYLAGFSTSVSVGAGEIYNVISPRLSFYYAADFNSLLPSSDRNYYPFIKGLALQAMYNVYLSGDFYYEQGLGLFAANDRIYNSSNQWGAGFILSILAGADLRGEFWSGMRIGLGGEYGLTVYNAYVRYMSLFFRAQYIISFFK